MIRHIHIQVIYESWLEFFFLKLDESLLTQVACESFFYYTELALYIGHIQTNASVGKIKLHCCYEIWKSLIEMRVHCLI